MSDFPLRERPRDVLGALRTVLDGQRRARMGIFAMYAERRHMPLRTGAVLSGFLQGFLLFLAIPIEWSLPFGGLPVFGSVTAKPWWTLRPAGG